MLKTISAALLAASVIAAPAFAAETAKDAVKDATKTTAPVIKADPTQNKAAVMGKPEVKSDAKADVKAGAKADVRSDAKTDIKTSNPMNANAAVTTEQHKTVHAKRHHGKTVSSKKVQPDLTKPMAPAASDKRS